jgi:hypothetical protein
VTFASPYAQIGAGSERQACNSALGSDADRRRSLLLSLRMAGSSCCAYSQAIGIEALREAEFELSGGAAFVWIVDGDGHLISPADQIKTCLDQAARAT